MLVEWKVLQRVEEMEYWLVAWMAGVTGNYLVGSMVYGWVVPMAEPLAGLLVFAMVGSLVDWKV